VTTTKLSIANGAMRLLKERHLTQSELTNGSREPARLFNAVWDDGGVRACLEAGQWKFAKRSAMLDASPSVEPEFGFQYAFDKPTDCARTIGVWQDAACSTPLNDYRDEAGFWLANQETIYVSYVSDDAEFGADYSLWPQSFLLFAQAHFAWLIAGPMTDSGQEIEALRKRLLSDALSKDAMSDPTKFLPAGSWVNARRAGGTRWRENG
jgi:hypothetical protein